MVNFLNCKSVVNAICDEVRSEINTLPRAPSLAILWGNNNEASRIYVSRKIEACRKVGIRHHLIHEPRGGTERMMRWLGDEGLREFDGVMVQLPVDDCDDQRAICSHIPPSQDVDCLHPENIGLLFQGRPRFLPCTPAGIVKLLDHNSFVWQGAKVCIINNSDIVGKPLALMLTNRGSTVTICHHLSGEDVVREMCLRSDLIVVAVGKPNFLRHYHLNGRQVVIDVGINRVEGKVVGDVSPSAYDHCLYATKVPGGIGPLTVASLIRNVAIAAKNRQ